MNPELRCVLCGQTKPVARFPRTAVGPDQPRCNACIDETTCNEHGPMQVHFGHIYHCQACCSAGKRCYTEREPVPPKAQEVPQHG